ncbi:MAG: response regulator [Sphingosinicella sp.]|nr:response regulator [Sphingosinicella sp.]
MSDEPQADRDDAPDAVSNGGGDSENAGKPLALICDDDEMTLDLMTLHMERGGFDVMQAANGSIAIARLRERPPQIVLLDMVMPVTSGEEVLRHMRDDPDLALIPVVVVTSRKSVRDAVSAFHNGAVDFVPKPFDPDDLVRCAKQALAGKGRGSG